MISLLMYHSNTLYMCVKKTLGKLKFELRTLLAVLRSVWSDSTAGIFRTCLSPGLGAMKQPQYDVTGEKTHFHQFIHD